MGSIIKAAPKRHILPPHYRRYTSLRSVIPFLHSSWQRGTWQWTAPFSPKCRFPRGDWTPFKTWFRGPTRVHNPNGMSVGSSVFAGLTTVTDRPTDSQTDRPHYAVCNNRPHLAAMQPNNLFLPKVIKIGQWFLRLQVIIINIIRLVS